MNQRKLTKKTTLLLLLLTIGFSGNAQKSGLFKGNNANLYTSAGIGGGSAHYIGDLTPLSQVYYVPFTNVRWNGTAHYTKYLNPNFGARVSFTWVRLYGDDFTFSKRNFDKMYLNYVRNLHFRNDVQEFVISGIWNLKKQYGNQSQIRDKFTPYVSAGFGIIGHNPKAIAPAAGGGATPVKNSEWIPLKQFNTAGQGLPSVDKKPYSLIVPVIPLAVGFRMRVADNFDLGFEAGYRLTLTDYLDDVGSDNYPNFAELVRNYGTAAGDFSYRADEEFHAVSGKSRVDDFQRAYDLSGITPKSGATPQADARTLYNPENPEVRRGSGTAFYHRFDMYLTTQITLSYVISSRVKCPPMK